MKTSQIVWRILFALVVFTLASFAMLSAAWWIRNTFPPYGHVSAGWYGDYTSQIGIMGAVAFAFASFFAGLVFYHPRRFSEEVTAFKRQLRVFLIAFATLLAGMWAYLNVVPQWIAYQVDQRNLRAGHEAWASHEKDKSNIPEFKPWPKGSFATERPILALLEQKHRGEEEMKDYLELWGNPETRGNYYAKYVKILPDSEYMKLMREIPWKIAPISGYPYVIAESEAGKFHSRQEDRWAFYRKMISNDSLRDRYWYIQEPGWSYLASLYRAFSYVFLPCILLLVGFAVGIALHLRVNPKYHRLVILGAILVLIIVLVPQHYEPIAYRGASTKLAAIAPLGTEALLVVLALIALFLHGRKLHRLERQATTEQSY